MSSSVNSARNVYEYLTTYDVNPHRGEPPYQTKERRMRFFIYIYIYILQLLCYYLFECIRISHKKFPSPMYTIRLFTKRTPLRRARRGRRATFAVGVLNLSPPTRFLSFPLKIQTIRSIATPTYSVFQRVRIRISPISTRLFALLRVSICAPNLDLGTEAQHIRWSNMPFRLSWA